MDLDQELRDFRDECRLFPLPGAVLFPHAVLPLHIFEPRYRQMTQDALDSDRLVTIVRLRPDLPPTAADDPAIEPIGCLGKILNCERLPDGRFNFLLLGLSRVRIVAEVPSARLYRVAEAVRIPDERSAGPEEPRRSDLIRHFREVLRRQDLIDSDLNGLLEGQLPLGPLTDLVAHAMGLPPTMKQALLDETQAHRRADHLIEVLARLLGDEPISSGPSRDYPPPFSPN